MISWLTPNLTLLIWELRFGRELANIMKIQEFQEVDLDECARLVLMYLKSMTLEFLGFHNFWQLTSKLELLIEKGQIWGQGKARFLSHFIRMG